MEILIGVLAFTIGIITSLSGVSPIYPKKDVALIWQETGLSPDQLSEFLSNKNCHQNEKKFLACISAISKISKEQKLKFSPPGVFSESRSWESEKASLKPWQVFYVKNPKEAKNINFEHLWEKELLKKIPLEYQALMTASGINGYLSVDYDPHTYIFPTKEKEEDSKDIAYLVEKEYNFNYETISIESFENGACEQFKKSLSLALKTNQKLSLIFIDLQDNPGGYVHEAVCIASLLLGKKKIVELKSFSHVKQPEVFYGKEEQMFWGNVILLMNSASASASELLAGALKAYDRVSIAGERTYGKGTYQETSLWRSNQKISIRQTQGYFFSPDGYSPQIQGIVPDHPIQEKTENLREPDLFLFPLERPNYSALDFTTK